MKPFCSILIILVAFACHLYGQDSSRVKSRWKPFLELNGGWMKSSHGYPGRLPAKGAAAFGWSNSNNSISVNAAFLQRVANTLELKWNRKIVPVNSHWSLGLELGAGYAWMKSFQADHFGDTPPTVPNMAIASTSAIFKTTGFCADIGLTLERKFANGSAILLAPEWTTLWYQPDINTTYFVFNGSGYDEIIESGNKKLFQYYIGLKIAYRHYWK